MQTLKVAGTRVTKEGLASFRRARPEVAVEADAPAANQP
jgi:hypothetical protein